LERGAKGEGAMRYARFELRRSALPDVFERMAAAKKAPVAEP
jgi:hypothetical protein